jgi:hypothetical protein
MQTNSTAPARRSPPVPQPLFRQKQNRPSQMRRLTGDWRSCAVGWLADQTTVGKGEALHGARFDAIATELNGLVDRADSRRE